VDAQGDQMLILLIGLKLATVPHLPDRQLNRQSSQPGLSAAVDMPVSLLPPGLAHPAFVDLRRPPGSLAIVDPERRPDTIRPARPIQRLPDCVLLPDPYSSHVVRNGKSMPMEVAFPALASTPPKLWEKGRCAGEGMR
jgi:hypothetical protein